MNEGHSLIRWIRAHDLLTYFILTFLLVFGGWFLAILSGIDALFDFGLWGPALSALLIIAVTRGKPGLKDLFRRLRLWRVPARWYLVILFGWPAISILAALLHAQITNQPITIDWSSWSGTLTWLSSALILGLWACEEIGWRGFALPRLLNRWNALFSSIVLGIVWACWHLPYYAGPNGISPDFYALPIFTVSVSILMTWVFVHTRGSILVAIFFHFWINVYSGIQSDKLPLADPGGETIVQYLLLAATAIFVVVQYGYQSLSRDRKGSVPVELKAAKAKPDRQLTGLTKRNGF